jgi:CelD/BcsL family acetyltransferase involved in cellulose biosynthesis
MQIDVVRPHELTVAEVALWTDFQGADPELESPFLAPHWPRIVETAQTPPRTNVVVALVHERGQVRAFFPAKVRAGVAMAAGAPVCAYQTLIAAPGFAMDLRELIGVLGVGRFDFSQTPTDQIAFAPYLRGEAPSWIARLPFGYDAYAADKAEESQLLPAIEERRARAQSGLGPVAFTAFSRSSADLEQLMAWKKGDYRRTGRTDIFKTGWTAALLRELFVSRNPDFGGVMFTLHIGETLVAAQFHVRGAQALHAWCVAENPGMSDYLPGLMLAQDIMRWMDDTPYTSIDFGVGDQPYKQALANDARMVGHGFVGRPCAATLVRSAAYGLRGVAEQLPLGRMSAMPGEAMRRADLIRGLR